MQRDDLNIYLNYNFDVMSFRGTRNLKIKTYFVYILCSKYGVLYVGVTSNLERRIYEHKNKIIKGFTEKYNVDRLIYFEGFDQIKDAISAEKKIKGWSRNKKLELIKISNPDLNELYSS